MAVRRLRSALFPAFAVCCIATALIFPSRAEAQTVAERVYASYDSVTSLVCQVRKDTESPVGKMRTLSRVYYQRPDRLHVENVSPVKRRIVSDGSVFYSYIEGDPRGFSRPVHLLDEEMQIQLRKVPGTAMDHLHRLRDLPETDVEAEEGFPVRKGYRKGDLFVVLSLDAQDRLARIEFYRDETMSVRTAEYRYSAFTEAVPGAWIPTLSEGTMDNAGTITRETSRVDNLAVNGPIPENLFVAGPFFKRVKFVDSFEKIYDL